MVLIFAILLGIGGYILKETRFGLYLYAVGNNDEAARRAGVKVARIKMAAFAIAGGIAALAGVLGALRDGYFEETKMARVCTGAPVESKLMGYSAPIIGHVSTITRGLSVSNAAAGAQGLPNVDPIYTWAGWHSVSRFALR